MNKITALIEMYTQHIKFLKEENNSGRWTNTVILRNDGKIGAYEKVIKDLNTIIDNS